MSANPPEGEAVAPPARAWLVVGLLWVAACLNYLDRNMILTMRASVKEAIPMSEAEFGLLTSVFLWVYAILSPFAGYLADRVSRSGVIVASLFVWSFVTWLTGHATTFNQLLAARALMGISEACYIPAACALIADYHRGATRSRAMAIHFTGFVVGSGMGGIGGWLASGHSWSYAFLLFGYVGIGHSLLMYFVLRDVPREGVEKGSRPAFLEALASLLSQRSYLLMLVIWGLLGLAGWSMAGWLPTHFGERFGLDQTKAGFTATVSLAIAGVIGGLAGGAWADRWSRGNPRGRILVPMVGMAIAAPGIFLVSYAGVLPVALVGIALYSGRNFTDANLTPVLCLVTDPRYRATGLGVMNLVACTVGGLATYAGGALRDAKVDVAYMFAFAAAGLLLSGILFNYVKPIAAQPAK